MVKRTAGFYGPIVELSRLQGELNRLFAAFVETNNKGAGPGSSWDPNVDVSMTATDPDPRRLPGEAGG
jgi:hypothetical protein